MPDRRLATCRESYQDDVQMPCVCGATAEYLTSIDCYRCLVCRAEYSYPSQWMVRTPDQLDALKAAGDA